MDRAGRWHVAFAVIPEPVPAPGNGQVVGIDRGENPGRNVRQKAGLNRGILASCWGLLATGSEQKAAASGAAVIYVDPKYSSRQCRTCGHIASSSRESQAVFL